MFLMFEEKLSVVEDSPIHVPELDELSISKSTGEPFDSELVSRAIKGIVEVVRQECFS